MQLETDEDMTKWVEDHTDSIRMLTLMVPGTPWELPANLPVVLRRYMERQEENRLHELRGQKQEPFDLGGAASDMISYSIGIAQLSRRVGDMIGEWGEPEVAEPVVSSEQRRLSDGALVKPLHCSVHPERRAGCGSVLGDAIIPY